MQRTVPVLVVAVLVSSCGRSSLKRQNPGEPLPADGAIGNCQGDLDCGEMNLCAAVHCVAGACVASPPVVCDDGNPCTTDSCVKETGDCQFQPLTRDEDGDGHPGPIPGFAPGSPGSCGDDCNDTSALAHPGAIETCDGVDNDCNGIVDDGSRYRPSSLAPVLLSTAAQRAGLGGIAFGTHDFAVSFASQNASWSNTFTAFDPTGRIIVPSTSVTHVNTDSFTGPLVFTGSVFGLAWEDRRDGNFEIYFNRLDADGNKLTPDLRITNAPRFSLFPDILWTGADYDVVWSDTREGDASGLILGQRIDADGHAVGQNVHLSDDVNSADGARIAKGETELGLIFNRQAEGGRELVFRTVSPDLSKLGPLITIGGAGAASAAITWNTDRYVIVWDTETSEPGPTIRGAAVTPSGAVIIPQRDVTSGAAFSRSEAILPLGDRLLLVWAEQSGGPYALHSKMIAPDLSQLTVPDTVTTSPSDSLSPALSFGPTGVVGIAFEDRRTGAFQVYATRLDCQASTP